MVIYGPTTKYTKETMMSLKAKFEMVLLDKKPLSNLVVRDAIVKYMRAAETNLNIIRL
jgi:hypothetical protein